MSNLTEHYLLLLGLDEAWVVEGVDLAGCCTLVV